MKLISQKICVKTDRDFELTLDTIDDNGNKEAMSLPVNTHSYDDYCMLSRLRDKIDDRSGAITELTDDRNGFRAIFEKGKKYRCLSYEYNELLELAI